MRFKLTNTTHSTMFTPPILTSSRNHLLALTATLLLFILAGCGPQTIEERYSEAQRNGHARATAQGTGSYTSVVVSIENLTDDYLVLEVDAGIFFANPDNKAQSLITTQDVPRVKIDPKETAQFTLNSACTDASRRVPATDGPWPQASAPKALDIALLFYGEHDALIGRHLAKKNPEQLGTEEQRRHFRQVMIWAYMGNDYDQILNMLTQQVYHNDIARARAWLQDVHAEAQRLATLVRERNTAALKAWLTEELHISEEHIEQAKDKIDDAKDRLNRFRDRFN